MDSNIEYIKNDLKNINENILRLEIMICVKFNELENQIKELKCNNDKISDMQVICGKINTHIDFIENTYSAVKMPLNFVKKNIEKLMGKNNTSDLPSLNN